ncbi:hypothetical protein QBC44DRAFT_235063 [Cladorrhinum sp. PSN332]|nr:hypothetical protein QBC44DRAFT_235063 [Cladorrhinum sp. PSN332]
MPSRRPTTSRAFDITHPSSKHLPTTNPRKYTRYVPARNLFFSSFPSGVFSRIRTPSTNLLCGLYAIILSFTHQHPTLEPVPNIPQLNMIVLKQAKEYALLTGVMDSSTSTDNLTGDQLAAVFAEWVRMYMPGGRKRGQLGYLSEVEGWDYGAGEGEKQEGREVPVMMDTADVKVEEEEEEGGDIVRIWVWNDGRWVNGGMGHWEGIKSHS